MIHRQQCAVFRAAPVARAHKPTVKKCVIRAQSRKVWYDEDSQAPSPSHSRKQPSPCPTNDEDCPPHSTTPTDHPLLGMAPARAVAKALHALRQLNQKAAKEHEAFIDSVLRQLPEDSLSDTSNSSNSSKKNDGGVAKSNSDHISPLDGYHDDDE